MQKTTPGLDSTRWPRGRASAAASAHEAVELETQPLLPGFEVLAKDRLTLPDVQTSNPVTRTAVTAKTVSLFVENFVGSCCTLDRFEQNSTALYRMVLEAIADNAQRIDLRKVLNKSIRSVRSELRSRVENSEVDGSDFHFMALRFLIRVRDWTAGNQPLPKLIDLLDKTSAADDKKANLLGYPNITADFPPFDDEITNDPLPGTSRQGNHGVVGPVIRPSKRN